MDTIEGLIENIVYTHPESGFTVAKIKEKRTIHCIVGIMPSIQPGETLVCHGQWTHHPSHGKQFEVSSYKTASPSDLLGIKKYLESGLVKGIGAVYAQKIVDKFGLDTLNVIDNHPYKLQRIQGIGKKKIDLIISCWQEQKSIRDVMVFLRKYNISPAYAQKIYKHYKEKCIKIVKENPYQLAKDIIGIGFKIADKIALEIGLELSSPKRIEAAIEYVLWELSNNGHTCYPKNLLIQEVIILLELEQKLIEQSLQTLIENKQLINHQIEEEKTIELIFLSTFYYLEKTIVKELNRIIHTPVFFRSFDIEKAINWSQEHLNMEFADEQKEAVRQALSKKIHIITGGPGTGKSTITNAILHVMQHLTDSVLLAAPTGKAAKRLSQITRKKAHTIHSLLEFDFIHKGFKKNKANPLHCSLIIIDEASMIDTYLMANLLKAIPSEAKVILIGDVDQLPSVGAGNILKDIIHSKKLPVTLLKKIFRQKAYSNIITNAHLINEGQFPHITPSKNSDFFFFEIKNPEDIEKKIITLVTEEIPAKKNFHPIADIQVISPMKKGRIGIENLNVVLQNALNPSTSPLYRAGHRFHVGDKVMQIKNNYNKIIFNGDVGIITEIDLEEQLVSVNFDGKIISYDFAELDEITLAYAVSVHKYQGSECPCIIVPIHTSHFKLLYRNLLYTAVTRGKKLVILLGTKQALGIAVKNNHVQKRYTGLKNFLENYTVKQSQQTMLPGF